MRAIRPFPDFDKPLSGDAGHSWTMPARHCIDPAVHEREKRDASWSTRRAPAPPSTACTSSIAS